MTLGELITALRKASSDPAIKGLVALLEEWKASPETTEELRLSIEKYIGNSWIASDGEHKTVYALWSGFRDDCICGRGGMSINERLFCFDLFELWDSTKTAEERTLLRHKVDFPSS